MKNENFGQPASNIPFEDLDEIEVEGIDAVTEDQLQEIAAAFKPKSKPNSTDEILKLIDEELEGYTEETEDIVEYFEKKYAGDKGYRITQALKQRQEKGKGMSRVELMLELAKSKKKQGPELNTVELKRIMKEAEKQVDGAGDSARITRSDVPTHSVDMDELK